jgi:hypothetical protein
MGSLIPGATYIYERSGEEIGYQYENKVDPRTVDGRPLYEHLKEDKLWGEIRRAAKTNEALQSILDRAILVYHLSKDHGKK